MAEYDPLESSFLIWMNTHSFPFFISLVSFMLIYTMARTSAALAFVQRLLLVLPFTLILFHFASLFLFCWSSNVNRASSFLCCNSVWRGGQGKGDIICLVTDAFSAGRL